MNSCSYSTNGAIELQPNNSETLTDPSTPCNCSVNEFDYRSKATERLFSIKAKITRLNDIQNDYEGPPIQDGEECFLLNSALSEVSEIIELVG